MASPLDGIDVQEIDLPPSAAASSDAAVDYLVGHLVRSGKLRPADAPRLALQVRQREALGSTGIGRGVALPHSKSEAVDHVVGVLARSAVPVPWPGAVDDVPIHRVCLLIGPATQPGEYMRALEAIVRHLRAGPDGPPGKAG